MSPWNDLVTDLKVSRYFNKHSLGYMLIKPLWKYLNDLGLSRKGDSPTPISTVQDDVSPDFRNLDGYGLALNSKSF